MNVPIIDPLQGDFPEVIEEFLECGVMKCVAFNRRGKLLAAGCSDGSCVMWDFDTRGVIKVLRDKECVAAVTSISWSKNGQRILVAAADKSLTLWEVRSGHMITRMSLQQTLLQVRLHPGAHTPSLCLACPLSSAPMIIDLTSGSTCFLPASVPDMANESAPPSRGKPSDGTPILTPTAACFNKYGDLVYIGNSRGEILIVDHKSSQVRAVVSIPGNAVVKNITFSWDGQFLLTNSNDRIIRVYENLLPLKGELKALNDLDGTAAELGGFEKLKVIGSSCLRICRDLQDSVTKVHWKAPCFSGDGEWVVGGSASKGEHKIYIWDRDGRLVKFLEGPNEAIMDIAWHPVHPIFVSVSITGLVYIWAKEYTENWSAFAPDFKELEENEEYVEREDEFDLNPETDKVKESVVDEDEEVDIVTIDKDTAFSDSDMSEEEVSFLYPYLTPEVPEEQENFMESPITFGENDIYGILDEDARLYEQEMTDASPMLEDGNGQLQMKRKRKPSKKKLEMLDEGVSKPLKSLKSSGKLLKVKDEFYG